MQLALSHLGYRPDSPKLVTLWPGADIGRPDDTPYLEESFAIEWNTLEHWDVPYAHTINAIAWL
jgi:hypothetical protein